MATKAPHGWDGIAAAPEEPNLLPLPQEMPPGSFPYLNPPSTTTGVGTLPGDDPEVDLPQPVSTGERSNNPLRPSYFHEIIGQEKATRLMRRVVDAARKREQPLDHVLLVGPAGTGKSTFSHVIAHELGVDVYEVEAPVSHETLLMLREVMQNGDMLRIEEIHQQAMGARDASTSPEVIYALLEDFVLPSGSGILDFPRITVVGTTTDEGMLPDPFLARFPLRPHLELYKPEHLRQMARWNADKLGLTLSTGAGYLFANAARGVPRQLNNYVKNAAMLTHDGVVDYRIAQEVLFDLNGVSADGLTRDMQNMLTFIFRTGKRTMANGEVRYQSSVNSIATGIGKSRDSKSINLRVEPYLIQKGYIQVGHGGRTLTDEGIARAKELLNGATP